MQNEEKNIGDKKSPEKKSDKKIAWVIVVVAIALAVLGIFALQKNDDNKEEGEVVEREKFFLDEALLEADFENGEILLQSELVPPAEMRERYEKVIDESRKIIDDMEESELSEGKNLDVLEEAYLTIASSRAILGDYAQAKKAYEEMNRVLEDDYKGMVGAGDLYSLMRQYRDSADMYTRVIDVYPNDYRIYDKLADLYVRHSVADDKLEKADMVFEYGAKYANRKSSLYSAYANFLTNFKKDEEKATWARGEYDKYVDVEEGEQGTVNSVDIKTVE